MPLSSGISSTQIAQKPQSTEGPEFCVTDSKELVYLTILTMKMLTKREMMRPFDTHIVLVSFQEILFAQQMLLPNKHDNSQILSVKRCAREYILVCARRPSHWKMVVEIECLLDDVLPIITQALNDFEQPSSPMSGGFGIRSNGSFERPKTAFTSRSPTLGNAADNSLRPASSDRMIASTGRWKFDFDAEIRVFLRKGIWQSSKCVSSLNSSTTFKTNRCISCDVKAGITGTKERHRDRVH